MFGTYCNVRVVFVGTGESHFANLLGNSQVLHLARLHERLDGVLSSFLAVEGSLKQFGVVVVCIRSESAHWCVFVRTQDILAGEEGTLRQEPNEPTTVGQYDRFYVRGRRSKKIVLDVRFFADILHRAVHVDANDRQSVLVP